MQLYLKPFKEFVLYLNIACKILANLVLESPHPHVPPVLFLHSRQTGLLPKHTLSLFLFQLLFLLFTHPGSSKYLPLSFHSNPNWNITSSEKEFPDFPAAESAPPHLPVIHNTWSHLIFFILVHFIALQSTDWFIHLCLYFFLSWLLYNHLSLCLLHCCNSCAWHIAGTL